MSEFDELIQLEVDGPLQPAQRRRLDDRLASDPELRARRDALRETVARLEGLARPHPEPSLTGSVMDAVHALPARAARTAPQVRLVRARLPRPTLLRFAATFAAGVLLGALAFGALQSLEPEGQAGLSATLGPAPAPTDAEDAVGLDRVRLDAEGLRAEARTALGAEGQLLVDVSIESGEGIAVELTLPGGLAAVGVDRSGGRPGPTSIAVGRVQLEGLGPGRYRLTLARVELPTRPLRLTAIAGAERVERVLQVAGTEK